MVYCSSLKVFPALERPKSARLLNLITQLLLLLSSQASFVRFKLSSLTVLTLLRYTAGTLQLTNTDNTRQSSVLSAANTLLLTALVFAIAAAFNSMLAITVQKTLL